MMQADIQDADWRWPRFTRRELMCKDSGECRMSPYFMDRLEKLREAYGKPLIVRSGYRSPAYNQKVSTTGPDGPHTHGRAIDVYVAGTDAYNLMALATAAGFTGIGIKQKESGRFMHLDDLTALDGFSTRPWVWTY